MCTNSPTLTVLREKWGEGEEAEAMFSWSKTIAWTEPPAPMIAWAIWAARFAALHSKTEESVKEGSVLWWKKLKEWREKSAALTTATAAEPRRRLRLREPSARTNQDPEDGRSAAGRLKMRRVEEKKARWRVLERSLVLTEWREGRTLKREAT